MKKHLLLLSIFSTLLTTNVFPQTTQPEKNATAAQNEVKKVSVSAEEASKSALNVGAKIPTFSLLNATNELIASEDLLEEGNLVLVFYRGAWCPYCNVYLRSLQKNLAEIKENGGILVAISVENPDNSMSVAKKNELEFTVLSDPKLDIARKFGLVFQLPAETNERYKGFGIDLAKQNGTETPDLPVSATYVVNNSGEIVYAFLDADYKRRAEPNEIIDVLKRMNTSDKPVEKSVKN